ncbi:MAG: zinc ribbon domain-containing protein [Deltaproteobacteria bacterium]|nr:zinc ribbon domain-containing protein [Deltaproteobacteria bacterium]
MPTYAYKCFDCEKEFEVFQKITDSPVAQCEGCGSSNVKRLLFASPFQLKGSGWYKTDYASSGSSSASSSVTEPEQKSSIELEKGAAKPQEKTPAVESKKPAVDAKPANPAS